MLLLIQILLVCQLPLDEPLCFPALLLIAYAACVTAQRHLPAPNLERRSRYLFAAILGWMVVLLWVMGRPGCCSPWSWSNALTGVYGVTWPCLWLRFPRAAWLQQKPWLGVALTALAVGLTMDSAPPIAGNFGVNKLLITLTGLASLAQMWPGKLARALLVATLAAAAGPVTYSWIFEGCKGWIFSLGSSSLMVWPLILSAKARPRPNGNKLDLLP
ncbi:hypothetical protein IV102_15180 [bacterium]|nr:hypothetical protein [bacterium]